MCRWWMYVILTVVILSALFTAGAFAHPGSGIVVDDKGRVFFQDSTGRAIWMIDSGGRLTKYTDKLGGHFMALDPEGWFASGKLKRAKEDYNLEKPGVERITPIGVKPALLVADGCPRRRGP